jgi:hypothetical protein
MNARSNLDAIAAIQAEEITDTVLYETELDASIHRVEIRFLPRRTALGFYRLREPSERTSASSSLSSAAEPTLIPELYCVGVITEKISSEAGPKIVIIHEDTGEGIAMSSFRNGDSMVFGLNDSGIWQHRNRLMKVVGDLAFNSLRPFWGPIQQLSPDTIEIGLIPQVTTESSTRIMEAAQSSETGPIPQGTTEHSPRILEATQRSVKDVKEATKKSEAARGLRTSFFNNMEALQQMVRNVYDLTEDARLFTNIKKRLQHTAEHLEGLKSHESTLNILSFNFMPINPKSKYATKDLQNHFTFKDLLFPEQSSKPMEDFGTLQDVVKNFRILMTELMTNPVDKQRWNNILTPMYDSFDSEHPQHTIRTAKAEDVYTYLQETFRDMVIFLTEEQTESLSADKIEERLQSIWKLDTERLLFYSIQADNLRESRKRDLESMSSAASSKQEAGGSAGTKKTGQAKKSAKKSSAASSGADKTGTDLCLSDCAFVIRKGENATPCKFGKDCRYTHKKLPYLKSHKKEVLELFEASRDTNFRTETIALIKAWP